MATRIRIQCINKTPRPDPHLRISHVGGLNADNTRWKLSLDDAIKGVENGTYSFFVHVGTMQVDVVVATHSGHKYLKTRNDGLHPDNLLSLQECPQ